MRPDWDEYFLSLVDVIGSRATCNRGKSGCVIVNKELMIISTGYVGSCVGDDHCDDVGHLMYEYINDNGNSSHHCVRTIHAEMNSLAQAARRGVSTNESTIYCTMTPCFTCAKSLVQSGIKRVVAKYHHHADQLSINLFNRLNIKLDIINNEIMKYE